MSPKVMEADPPAFVGRDKEPEVREWLARARVEGGFLVVTGEPGVGKTRLLYEAVRRHLPDIPVLAPEPGDGAPVNAAAAAGPDPAGLVVWLDELQRFVDGPYLVDGATPITRETIDSLLDAAHPVIVLGTLQPAHVATLRSVREGSAPVRQLRYLGVSVILHWRCHHIRLAPFSAAERAEAARLAARDRRLAAAVADPDFHVTEALAGARKVVDRYLSAGPAQRAIVDAAVDARRVGILAPLTADLLRAAAPAYLGGAALTGGDAPAGDARFGAAVAALTGPDQATGPLLPVTAPGRHTVLGYTVRGALQSRLTPLRRAEPVPAAAWRAFADHAGSDDLDRLARAARERLRYGVAAPIYARLADAGDPDAARWLAELLARQGRAGDLQARHDAGDALATDALAGLLADGGRVEEAVEVARAAADAGDAAAAATLVDLLARLGRFDEIRARAEAGDRDAARHTIIRLHRQGGIDEAIRLHRAVFSAESDPLVPSLARLLEDAGHLNEAIEVHRAAVDGADPSGPSLNSVLGPGRYLAELLARAGRLDELRVRADAGDYWAASWLAELHSRAGRTAEAEEVRNAWAVAATERRHAAEEAAERRAAERLADPPEPGGVPAPPRPDGPEPGDPDPAAAERRTAAERRADPPEPGGVPAPPRPDGPEPADPDPAAAEIDRLRAQIDEGSITTAAESLTGLLTARGRDEDAIEILRAHADAGNPAAAEALADLLLARGGADALRAEVEAGTPGAHRRWLGALRRQGRQDLADRLARWGLTPDGAPAGPDAAR